MPRASFRASAAWAIRPMARPSWRRTLAASAGRPSAAASVPRATAKETAACDLPISRSRNSPRASTSDDSASGKASSPAATAAARPLPAPAAARVAAAAAALRADEAALRADEAAADIGVERGARDAQGLGRRPRRQFRHAHLLYICLLYTYDA